MQNGNVTDAIRHYESALALDSNHVYVSFIYLFIYLFIFLKYVIYILKI